jgi:hypothetical protein
VSFVTGSGGGTLVVPMAAGPYTDAANSSAWYPSADQHSSLVYQGSLSVPDLCHGGQLRLQHGGTFSAVVTSTDTIDAIHVRWHYRAHGTSGSWSGTASIIPGECM